MGYRSEVVLALSPQIMPHFLAVIARCPEARELCWAHSSVLIRDYNRTPGAMCFQWESIKWYESYAGVQAIQEFLSWCEVCEAGDLDAMDHIRFVRIGEELDDVDMVGYGFDIHVERSISY